MPSLTDIANQVNNTLTQIQTNTADSSDTLAMIKSDTADIKNRNDTIISRLETLNLTTQSGFSLIDTTLRQGFLFLGQGLYALLEAQREANSKLGNLVEQNKTVICWLGTIAEVLCRQLREAEHQTDVQERLLAAEQHVEALLELVHAREHVEWKRLQDLNEKIEDCCPEEPEPESPCFEPCENPKLEDYDPRGQEWKPPKVDRDDLDPVGLTHKPELEVKATRSQGKKK